MTATSEIEAGHLDAKSRSAARVGELPKAPTGISGLDEVTGGGVPRGLLLKTMVGNGEHNRVLYVRKSRGMAHSNQIREFLLTGQGIELADVYVGPEGVLTGSARQAQEAKERSDGTARLEELEQRRVNLERRRESVEAQTATLWREFEDEAGVVERLLSHGSTGVEDRAADLCEEHLTGHYEIEIIDLVEHPSLARGDDILAIPTLVRRRPEPSRKIIGDLSDTERVLVGLRLQPGSSR